MPYKKSHPGLDEAMSQVKLDEFMAGAPTRFEEPPVRRWPTVVLVAAVAFTAAVVTGALAAGWVTGWDIVAVTAVTAGAVTVLFRLDPERRRP